MPSHHFIARIGLVKKFRLFEQGKVYLSSINEFLFLSSQPPSFIPGLMKWVVRGDFGKAFGMQVK